MIIILIIGSYLLGSIPFAWLISRWFKGIDIRQIGSRNPGAANVIKQVGKGPGTTVVILDTGKGLIPVLLARFFGFPIWVAGILGLAAVIGHCWSVFLRFDGGEGMNTAMGAFLGLVPLEFLIAFSGGVVAGFLSKYLHLKGWFGSKINCGALTGFILLFILLFLLYRPLSIILIIVIFVAILIFRQVQTAKTHLRDF